MGDIDCTGIVMHDLQTLDNSGDAIVNEEHGLKTNHELTFTRHIGTPSVNIKGYDR